MSSLTPIPSTQRPHVVNPLPPAAGTELSPDALHRRRVLRNTYALLSMTLLFSAAVAAGSVAFHLPAPGLLLTLGGCFGLLFAVYKLRNSGWALPAVFGLTGFMGCSLGPMLAQSLALREGARLVTMTLAATGATFLALSAWVLSTRRDVGFLGGFLFAGMVITLLAAGLILHETSRIVSGGNDD